MIYSSEVKNMCVVAKGPNHGPAPIPEEGKWVYAKEIDRKSLTSIYKKYYADPIGYLLQDAKYAAK